VQFPVALKVRKKGKWVAVTAEARDMSLGGMI